MKTFWFGAWLVPLVFVPLDPLPAAAQAADRVPLEIRVHEATPCRPAPHARISIPVLDIHVVADSLGRAVVRAIPAGRYDLVVRGTDGSTVRGEVSVSRRSTVGRILVVDVRTGTFSIATRASAS